MRAPHRQKSYNSSIHLSILMLTQLCDFLYSEYLYSLTVITTPGKLNDTSGQFLIISAFKVNQEHYAELVQSDNGKWTINFNDFYFNFFVYRSVDKLLQQKIINLLITLREDEDVKYKELLDYLSTIVDKMSFEKEILKLSYVSRDDPRNSNDAFFFNFNLKNIYNIFLFAGIENINEKEKMFIKVNDITSIYNNVLGTDTIACDGQCQIQYFYEKKEFLLYEEKFLKKYKELKTSTNTISQNTESTTTSKTTALKNRMVEIVVISVTICLLLVGIVIYFFRDKIFKWNK
eukprot:GAHX01002857.1.p1 GENE.GAHX01002857.1~~GAHX01002857.1.p1  ORF type:complete len:290 (-),score=36.78 GAHX01002857.1:13-882(-)